MPLNSGQRVVLASNNPGKLQEMAEILANLDIELLPQSRFDFPEVDETGTTFIENAILKARAASSASGLPAIADDSGIEVDVLNGVPGIYSARYAGAGASDQDNLDLLVRNVIATGESNPLARYQCIIVYMRHADDPTPLIAAGTWEGYIVTEPRGTNGFGYDPVFFVPSHGCTSAELPSEVKNRISHRGQALNMLAQTLKSMQLSRT